MDGVGWRTLALTALLCLSLIGKAIADDPIDWSGYSKNVPPPGLTEVKISLYMDTMDIPSDVAREMHFSGYLRLSWYDKRISFKETPSEPAQTDDIAKNLWVPDVFIRNALDVNSAPLIKENLLVKVFPDKRIWYATRLSVKVSCPMRLQKFPFDTQKCPILFESFGYKKDRIDLTWGSTPLDFDHRLSLPAFTLVDTDLIDCSQNYSTGSYPCRQTSLIIQRESGWFYTKCWLPNVFLVIVSWFGFWMKPGSARIFLGLLILLIFGLNDLLLESRLPVAMKEVTYLTAFDLWQRCCWWLVAVSVLECVTVHCLLEAGRAWRWPCCRALCDKAGATAVPLDNMEEAPKDEAPLQGRGDNRPRALLVADRVMAVLIPVIFLIMNLFMIAYTV